jgi:hypothetical protein
MREIESLAPILSEEKIEIVKALVKANPGKLGFIAKGQETLVTFEEDKRFDKELQDIWALEDLERMRANYRKTLIQMESISSLLKMTEHFKELKKAAGLHIELIYPISENAYRAIESLENIITRIDRLESVLQERNKALSTLSDFLQREVEIGVPVMATTRGSFDTRARQHISADFGLAYIRKINEIISYAGANIYFRPINRDVPLREYSTLWHRFSLFIGITLNSIQKKEEIEDVERIVRDDLFGNSAILIGGGLRLTDTIRLSGGGLIFKHIDSNSQNGDLELTIKPFVAISFDLNIKPILENLGEAIAGK